MQGAGAEVEPVHRERVLRRAHDGGLAVQHELTVHRVILEEVRQIGGGNKIVHRAELDALLGADAINQTANTSETVDANLDSHVCCPLLPAASGANSIAAAGAKQ